MFDDEFNGNFSDDFDSDGPVVWKNPDGETLQDDDGIPENNGTYAPPEEDIPTDGDGAVDLYSQYEPAESSDSVPPDEEEQNEKTETPHTNKAAFLDRNKIMLVILGAGAALIVFVSLILPLFKNEKKAKKQPEKANAGTAPSDLLYWSAPAEPEFQMEDSNSAAEGYYNEEVSLEDRFPPPGQSQPQNTAPVQVPTSQPTSSSVSDFPKTNRNEQQKALAHVSLSDTDGYSIGQALGTLSGSSGSGYTSPAQSYTPSTLAANFENFLQNQSGYASQNGQDQKNSFFNTQDLSSGQYKWNTEFSLWKGTIIPAVLETAINTDLPGVVIATVTTNIYSSLDGKYILIPQGSKLYAIYNSSVTYGQTRVQIAWNTLIRPDGLEINLGGLNGVDAQGQSGYTGFTNTHPFEYAKALGLIAMFSVLDTKMENITASQNNAYAQNAIADTYSQVQKMNQQILDRALDIQPTIKIKAGTEVNLITNVTMDLPPAASVPATKYQR